MEALARLTIRGRWVVVVLWLLLTVAGAIAAGKLADRWYQQFSIPGYSAYEANQRTLEQFGTGRQYPMVLVFSVEEGDIREQTGIEAAIASGAAVNEGSRIELVVRCEERRVRLGGREDDVRAHLRRRRADVHDALTRGGDAGGGRGERSGGRDGKRHGRGRDHPVSG